MAIHDPLTIDFLKVGDLANEARQILSLVTNHEVIPVPIAKNLLRDIAKRIKDLIMEPVDEP